MNKSVIKGFSLIELMIVLLIAAILASVALPAYQNQVRKSKRAEGTAQLLQIMQLQERWKSENGTYTGTMGDLLATGSASERGYYNVVILAASGACPLSNCVDLRADATGSDTSYGSLQLRSDGTKRWKRDDTTWENDWPDT